MNCELATTRPLEDESSSGGVDSAGAQLAMQIGSTRRTPPASRCTPRDLRPSPRTRKVTPLEVPSALVADGAPETFEAVGRALRFLPEKVELARPRRNHPWGFSTYPRVASSTSIESIRLQLNSTPLWRSCCWQDLSSMKSLGRRTPRTSRTGHSSQVSPLSAGLGGLPQRCAAERS